MSSLWCDRSSWHGHGRPAGQRHIEAVDLTLSSSPSPEPQPRRFQKTESTRPAHSQSAPVKAQPGSGPHAQFTPVKIQPGSVPYRQHPTPYAYKSEPARRSSQQIHPEHLARIVNTSNPEALRSVLLHLCKLSPALSGAVARGLKDSSTFAQATIDRHRPTPSIKAELAGGRVYSKTDSSRPRTPSPMSDSPELLSSPKISAYIKHERKPSPAPSNGSSSTAFSDELLLKPLTQLGTSSMPPTRTAPQSRSASSNRGIHASHAEVKAEPRLRTLTCRRCQQPFEDGNIDDGCSYHPGHKALTNQRTIVYDCCGGGPREAGCMFEDFHAASHVQGMPRKRTPSYESPSFPIRTPKHARLF